LTSKLQSYENAEHTLTPITFEEPLPGINFTAPGSPCHVNKTAHK